MQGDKNVFLKRLIYNLEGATVLPSNIESLWILASFRACVPQKVLAFHVCFACTASVFCAF
jgi:hypothetical protein